MNRCLWCKKPYDPTTPGADDTFDTKECRDAEHADATQFDEIREVH